MRYLQSETRLKNQTFPSILFRLVSLRYVPSSKILLLDQLDFIICMLLYISDFYIRNKKKKWILYNNFNISNDQDAWSNIVLNTLYNVYFIRVFKRNLIIENGDRYPRLMIFRWNYIMVLPRWKLCAIHIVRINTILSWYCIAKEEISYSDMKTAAYILCFILTKVNISAEKDERKINPNIRQEN